MNLPAPLTAALAAEFDALQLLGRGAHGAVFAATHRPTGRRVALKLCAHPQRPELLQRFRREGELAARLQHPNLVKIHTTGDAAGHPYLVLELVQGARPLDQAWAKLPVPQRLELLHQAAQGVAHAHQHGVIHRDLKPDNILVDATGHVRVTDFGVATALDIERLTQTGELIGTPAYMAPEQLAGDPADARADVWALGTLTYLAATGELPYVVHSLYELIAATAHPPPPPSSATSGLPRGVDSLIVRTICDPGDRLPDAAAFERDLALVLAHRRLGWHGTRRPRRVLVVVSLLALLSLPLSLLHQRSQLQALRQATTNPNHLLPLLAQHPDLPDLPPALDQTLTAARGLAALQRGALDEARALAETLPAADPAYRSALRGGIAALDPTGDPHRAVADLTRALDAWATPLPDLYAWRAQALRRSPDWGPAQARRALDDLQALRAAQPNVTLALRLIQLEAWLETRPLPAVRAQLAAAWPDDPTLTARLRAVQATQAWRDGHLDRALELVCLGPLERAWVDPLIAEVVAHLEGLPSVLSNGEELTHVRLLRALGAGDLLPERCREECRVALGLKGTEVPLPPVMAILRADEILRTEESARHTLAFLHRTGTFWMDVLGARAHPSPSRHALEEALGQYDDAVRRALSATRDPDLRRALILRHASFLDLSPLHTQAGGFLEAHTDDFAEAPPAERTLYWCWRLNYAFADRLEDLPTICDALQPALAQTSPEHAQEVFSGEVLDAIEARYAALPQPAPPVYSRLALLLFDLSRYSRDPYGQRHLAAKQVCVFHPDRISWQLRAQFSDPLGVADSVLVLLDPLRAQFHQADDPDLQPALEALRRAEELKAHDVDAALDQLYETLYLLDQLRAPGTVGV